MSAFRSIVVELDPRRQDQPALARIGQLPVDAETAIELLVCDTGESPSTALGPAANLEAARQQYASELDEWLQARAAELAEMDTAVGKVTTRIVWHRPRYEAILDRAERAGADLIMRSAHYHSKLERLLVSATDWELIRRAPQTVWLVKKMPAGEQNGLRVLAAVDPFHAEEKELGLDRRVLAAASRIAGGGKRPQLFHAWQPGLAMAPAVAASPHVPTPIIRVDPDLTERLREQRQHALASLADEFDVPREQIHLVEGAVTDALDELVDSLGIDVVVAGGISRGRIERLIVGNTAEAILEQVDCDVVIVKRDGRGKET